MSESLKSTDVRPRAGVHVCIPAGVLFSLVILGIGISPANLFVRPDYDQFLAVFFQEPFVVLIGLSIGWYISSFKSTPSRAEEYKLLNSLPVRSRGICDRFIGHDLSRNAWVPLSWIALYVSLLSVSPLPFLCRFSILAAVIYALFVTTTTLLHIVGSLRLRDARGFAFPVKSQSIIMAIIITGYTIVQMTFAVTPFLASGYQFLFITGLLVTATYLARSLGCSLFNRWRENNVVFQTGAGRRDKSASILSPSSNPFQRFPQMNPFLLNNELKITRGKAVLSGLLTAAFIICAYLIAMNNEDSKDVFCQCCSEYSESTFSCTLFDLSSSFSLRCNL